MNLPLALAITVVVTSVAIAAMLLVRRRAPEGSYFQDGDRASGVFGVLAGGFAIFAGFVIFLAFTTYDQSRNGAEAEALGPQGIKLSRDQQGHVLRREVDRRAPTDFR